ncbi:OLC1v1023944C1 [Oldenlandia corymbosa var. corymbosa]|uniref:OLC1v1023944C1 n=1 Tax=Oldenlandia corymbosa var. corymbosa TaxID=529605 RepID=A0AAV1C3Z8_OLDCO|nr:OLC1v1023944C1 [Oldenlandia corymbosa var. corymbosa]
MAAAPPPLTELVFEKMRVNIRDSLNTMTSAKFVKKYANHYVEMKYRYHDFVRLGYSEEILKYKLERTEEIEWWGPVYIEKLAVDLKQEFMENVVEDDETPVSHD